MKPTASTLERALRCPASLSLPVVQSTSAASDRGTWRHAFLAAVGQVGAEAALAQVPEEHRAACEALPLDELPTDLTAELAFAFDVETGTARVLGANLGRQYGELRETEIPGAADVVGHDPAHRRALVLDWKSFGYAQRARDSVQLRFLALAAARVFDVDEVLVEVVRLSDDGHVWRDRYRYDVLDLDLFAAELRDAFASIADETPHEGHWCDHCPSYAFCPAKSRLALEVAEGRVLDGPDTMLPLSPERAGLAHQRVKLARKMLDHVERAVMACLDENGGSLPLPDGKLLVKRTVPGNEKLDGEVAFQVLADQHGPEVARQAVEMTATKAGLRDALRPLGTKRGQLAKLEAAALDEIRKRGGTSRGTKVVLDEVEALPQPQET